MSQIRVRNRWRFRPLWLGVAVALVASVLGVTPRGAVTTARRVRIPLMP
jgi:hypothetical protein